MKYNVMNKRYSLSFFWIFFFLCYCGKSDFGFHEGRNSILTGFENIPEKLSDSECSKCHIRHFQDQKINSHGRAWINPLFQSGYKVEPMNWCIHCHAPLESQKKEILGKTDGVLHNEGINCAVCHIRNGKIVSAEKRKDSPHNTVIDKTLNSSEFCAGCHEFNFPMIREGKFGFTSEPMQSVYSEWKNSGIKKNCQSCHFENHILKGPSSTEWLKKVLGESELTDSEKGFLHFRLEIIARRAHSFPAGDLFRSLSLEFSNYSDFRNLFFTKKIARFYGAGLTETGTFWNRRLVSDSTLKPDQNEIRLTLDDPGIRDIFVRIRFFYHDPELGGKTGAPEDSVILFEKKMR